ISRNFPVLPGLTFLFWRTPTRRWRSSFEVNRHSVMRHLFEITKNGFIVTPDMTSYLLNSGE
ncbi:hypothetical protein, partial [Treponema sp. R6D11]